MELLERAIALLREIANGAFDIPIELELQIENIIEEYEEAYNA